MADEIVFKTTFEGFDEFQEMLKSLEYHASEIDKIKLKLSEHKIKVSVTTEDDTTQSV